MNKRKSILFNALSLLLTSSLLLSGCGNSAEKGSANSASHQGVQLRVGASTTSTWIYGFISTWGQVMKKKLPEVNLSVQATSGSSAHYLMIEGGNIDLGSGFTPTEYYAANGEKGFTQQFKKFRAMMPVTDSRGHVITLAKRNDIRSIKDLDGKKVGVGSKGSPTTILTEVHASALGIKPQFVSSTAEQLMDMLADGRIDAAWYYAGAPWSTVLDLSSQTEVKFIPFTEGEIAKLQEAAPFTTKATISSQDYKFVKDSVLVPGALQTLIVSQDAPEDVVYKLTKATWENWDEITKLAPAAGKVSVKDVAQLKGKLHPGAFKYYQEAGIKIPDEIKP